MAHHPRRITSKDRNGTTTPRQPRFLRLVHKADTSPDTLPRESSALDPYEDFDILLTAGHNIG
jgi:hypothetical protein